MRDGLQGSHFCAENAEFESSGVPEHSLVDVSSVPCEDVFNLPDLQTLPTVWITTGEGVASYPAAEVTLQYTGPQFTSPNIIHVRRGRHKRTYQA